MVGAPADPILADGDPDSVTEQDAWARSVESVAAAFDEQQESDGDEYQSDPDRRSKKRSLQLCPSDGARLGVVCGESNLSFSCAVATYTAELFNLPSRRWECRILIWDLVLDVY